MTKRMKPLEQHQHLQVHQETAAPKRATAKHIDQGHQLLLPTPGMQQQGTSSARSLQKNPNGNRSAKVLPTEGQQRRVKGLKLGSLIRQSPCIGITTSGRTYKDLMDG